MLPDDSRLYKSYWKCVDAIYFPSFVGSEQNKMFERKLFFVISVICLLSSSAEAQSERQVTIVVYNS